MITFLSWYLTFSYLVGFVLFMYEMYRMSKQGNYHLLNFGIVLLMLSPLTAWHGVLHYMAVWWHHFNGTPFRPFI